MFLNKAFKDDPYTIHIFAHGYQKGMKTYGINGGETTTAKEFINILNTKSNIWKNKKDKDAVTIILHSCQTGDGEDSFAAEISEELDNVIVIAPDGNVRITESGEKGVLVSEPNENDEYGNWNVFQAGKQTNQMSGEDDPRLYYLQKMYNQVMESWNKLKKQFLD